MAQKCAASLCKSSMPCIIFCKPLITLVCLGSEVHPYAKPAVTPHTTTHLAGLAPFNVTSVCNGDFV